jgi:hypothetical protein
MKSYCIIFRDSDTAPKEGVPVGDYYKHRSDEYPTLEEAIKALKMNDHNARFADIVELSGSEGGPEVVPIASWRRNGQGRTGTWEMIASNVPRHWSERN